MIAPKVFSLSPEQVALYADMVYTFVCKRNHVSFVELEELLTPYFEVKGHQTLEDTECQNVIFWAGISAEFVNVTKNALCNKNIYVKSCHPLVYIIDGKMLTFPLAKRMQNYKQPHWMPVTFCLEKTSGKKTPKNKAASKGRRP